MLHVSLLLIGIVLSHMNVISAFAPVNISPTVSKSTSSALGMGWLDGILGSSEKATCSHILLKGNNADDQCDRIKLDIYKKAIGRGNPANGVEPEKLMKAFSAAAKSKSTCPSKKNGGALGTFGQGEMVPEFDAVAFKKEVGMIHGPIQTSFGSHLILITNRE